MTIFCFSIQYNKVNKNDFVKFSKVTERIDTVLFKYIGENNTYMNMFQVLKCFWYSRMGSLKLIVVLVLTAKF